MLGTRALAGRECDRCHRVQVAATAPPAAAAVTPATRKHSPGSDLLHGVLLNLANAISELWVALPRRRTRR